MYHFNYIQYFDITETDEQCLSELGVVDLAGPGISRGRNSRGGVAGNIASNARVSLLKRAVVGRHLDRAGPVAVINNMSNFAWNITKP